MTIKICIGRRPNGLRCTNVVIGKEIFCQRCDAEVFKTKAKFHDDQEKKDGNA